MKKTLKERRLALGLRLRDVAEMAKVSYGSCWNYENGKHSGKVIMEKYLAVVTLFDRLEKEKADNQEKNQC